MQDRIPLYPGRVKMTPVAGQANTYDMVRADDPTQAGTPLNKATFLNDATAALYGLGTGAVPDDVLNKLSKGVLAQIGEKPTKTTIGTLAVGETIKLNIGGAAKEFIVVHQGKPSSLYDDSCDGTWLLMKDIYENHVWEIANNNIYEQSDIRKYLDNAFLSLFDSNVKDAIKQVEIPYWKTGIIVAPDHAGVHDLSAKIFLLSGYEVGLTTSDNQYFQQDGAKLSYFESGTGTSANNKRIANLNGSAAFWWLRSPSTVNTSYVWRVSPSGACDYNSASLSYGIRPALVLPSTFAIYTDSSGNIYTEQEYETELTDVLGNLIQIPVNQIKDGVKIETGGYIGTDTYGADHPNTLTFRFKPKMVMIFGGSFFVSTAFIPFAGDLAFVHNSTESATWKLTRDKNTISWYANYAVNSNGSSSVPSAGAQLNDADVTYYYVAIG